MAAPEKKKAAGKFYRLELGNLPDELYRYDVPVQKWLDRCDVAVSSFPPKSLKTKHDISWDVHLERLVGIALYFTSNLIPFTILPFVVLYATVPASRHFILFVVSYVVLFAALEWFVFVPHFMKKYNRYGDKNAARKNKTEAVWHAQYAYTEWNTTKYLSTKFVWPESLHPTTTTPTSSSTNGTTEQRQQQQPLLFCIVPHGVAPMGITAYAAWSKLFNGRLTHWTVAPVVLKLPIVGSMLKALGYIPAKAKLIIETLTKKEENVGIVLDGIAGMFQPQGGVWTKQTEERAYLRKRKGVVKIALRAGVPIVPVYGFGHTSLYTVLVDPFGILERLSLMLDTSITPFFGRWGWFLGPPPRIPIAVCLGEPVHCPLIENPTQEQINEYHQKMLDSFQDLFETHKAAYGWSHKTLRIV